MHRLVGALYAIAVVSALVLAAPFANGSIVINITQQGSNVDVNATGNLDLTGATFDHQQNYSTGIIPGGTNWYIALGTTPGMDWYQLTKVTLPFGTSTNYFQSSITSGDAFSIWGFGGGAPLVGLPTGYKSGTPISADMTLSNETIADLTLIPGTYTFGIPKDTITLNIGNVPEPSTWVMMLNGLATAGFAAYRRSKKFGL